MEEESSTVKPLKYQYNFNKYLNREMTENETKIKQACFYFVEDHIHHFKLIIEQIIRRDFPVQKVLEYLIANTELSDIYFLQKTKNLSYNLKIL